MILVLAAMLLDDFEPKQFPADPTCSQTSTYDIAMCLRAQFEVWDGRMKREYRLASTRVGSEARPKLRLAQRLWVQYREANCAMYGAHGGTVSILFGAACWRDMTKVRTVELASMD